MSVEERLTDLLFLQLNGVYCDTCRFNNLSQEELNKPEAHSYYGCDGCIRKSMNWEISKDEAHRIAKLILKEL